MAEIKQIHEGAVLALQQSYFQVPHKPAGGEPEIVSDHHDCLDMLAIAVPKSGDQFRVLLTTLRVQPLLKLINDKQDLLVSPQSPSRRDDVILRPSFSTSPSGITVRSRNQPASRHAGTSSRQ